MQIDYDNPLELDDNSYQFISDFAREQMFFIDHSKAGVSRSNMKFPFVISMFFLLKIAICEENCSGQDCVVKYLNDKNEINVNPTKISCTNCGNVLSILETDFLESLNSKIDANNSKCVKDFIEEYKIVDLYLKGFAFNKLQMSNSTDFDKDVERSTKEASSTINIICGNREVSFEELQQTTQMLLSGTHFKFNFFEESEDNCVMKYLFENKISQMKQFDVPLEKINSTECDQTIEALKRNLQKTEISWIENSPTIFGVTSEKFKNCWRGKLSEQNFFLKVVGYYFFSFLDSIEESQAEVIADFKKSIVEFNRSFYDCSHEILKL